MVEQDDSIFGCDYSSKGGVTATGDIELIEGLDNAKQNIRNWLLTDKGYYPSVDDEYGSEIRNIFGEDFEKENVATLRIYIENALLDNPRVLEIESIEPYTMVDGSLKMLINVILVNGSEESFDITIDDEEGEE